LRYYPASFPVRPWEAWPSEDWTYLDESRIGPTHGGVVTAIVNRNGGGLTERRWPKEDAMRKLFEPVNLSSDNGGLGFYKPYFYLQSLDLAKLDCPGG
jgi:hypothetical protein